ncbi:sulfotransferase domain-containing protein [Frankia canadensis]|nr:sulfotransferase domain-containing protein [Frankia canadensis]
MAKPDFRVIGAPDAGTDLLVAGLRHRDAELAAGPDPHAPYLLADFEGLRRLHERSPYVRLVAVLRDPVARAYAHWSRMRAAGLETVDDFERALAVEGDRTTAAWDWTWRYRALGCYGAQLQRLTTLFTFGQVFLTPYARLWTEPAVVLDQVARFVGLAGAAGAGDGIAGASAGLPRVARVRSQVPVGSGAPVRSGAPAGDTAASGAAAWAPARLDSGVADRLRDHYSADHLLLEQVTRRRWEFGPDPG